MTEADWLTATDPRPMLEFLRGQASDRKLRLFAVACCREVWELLIAPASRRAVEVSEAFADGEASEDELRTAGWYAESATWSLGSGVVYDEEERLVAAGVLEQTDPWVYLPFNEPALAAELTTYELDSFRRCVRPHLLRDDLIRDIFGNPFHPVALDPAWRSETVSTLAAGIYADRAFDRLPILADALEEAGCDQPDILNHCRGPGPHVRGCWAVDLVLGKS